MIQRMIDVRIDHDESQRELAAAIGYHQVQIARYETGQNSPPAMAANKLDHFLPRRCVKKICRWHIFSIRSRRLCRRSIRLEIYCTLEEKRGSKRFLFCPKRAMPFWGKS